MAGSHAQLQNRPGAAKSKAKAPSKGRRPEEPKQAESPQRLQEQRLHEQSVKLRDILHQRRAKRLGFN